MHISDVTQLNMLHDVTCKMFITILQDNQVDGKLHVETSVG